MKNTKKSSAKASSASQRTQNAWNTRKANQAKQEQTIENLVNENIRFYDKIYKLENPVTLKKESMAEQLKREREETEVKFDKEIKGVNIIISDLNELIQNAANKHKTLNDQKKSALLEIERKIEYHNIDLKLEAKINQRF